VVEAAGSEEPINVILEDELVMAPPPGGEDDDEAEQTMMIDRPPAPLPRPSKPPMRWEKKR
jgi:hypothetical protein